MSGLITTVQLLRSQAERQGDKVYAAVRDGGTMTYGEALVQAEAVRNGLASCGVRRGDRVSAWLPNGLELISSIFGANLLGAALAPCNVAYRGGVLQHVVNLAAAEILIAHEQLVPRLEGLDLPHLRMVVVVGDSGVPVPAGLQRLDWGELVSLPAPGGVRDPDPLPHEDMIVIYTSGTTGVSKGVRCSYLHHAEFSRYLQVGDLGGDDRALVTLPLFHIGGTKWLYTMLRWGGSIGVLPRFSTESFWDDVRALGATTGTILAAMAGFLLAEPQSDDDAENPLRIALVNPTHPQWAEFEVRFGVQLWSGFGMTEVPGVLKTPLSYEKLDSVGRVASADWELRLVDDHDEEVTPGEAGEAIVRHARPWTITHGYVGMPEATATAWRNGWFHTGDILVRDLEGDFYFVDRKKDSLRRRGENVSSFEVESEITRHPEVLEAAVVAVRADTEDDILAFVLRRPASELEHAALVEFLVPRMAHFMIPRYFEFVDEMPRTPTQKIQKDILRERGISTATWDRESMGMLIKADRLS
ncbi:MAG: AMP-binding protein [Acidimicrobiia bacterium]